MTELINPAAASPRKWMKVRWTRVALGLGLVFVCLAALLPIAWFLEPWYFAHEMSRGNAYLNVIPSRLPDKSASPPAHTRLQAFEFSFQAPWEHVENRKDFKSVSIFKFAGGPYVTVFDPAGMTNLSSGLRNQSMKLESVFGTRALSSNYDWMAAELTATPEQIHWWNRAGNVRVAVLLGLKNIEILDRSAIYRIGNDEVKGFQIGDPAKAPLKVGLELFDVNNRRYEVFIASRQGDPAVTQADLNAIVASFRPIPHS